jgi:hypothetical protein
MIPERAKMLLHRLAGVGTVALNGNTFHDIELQR